MEQPQALDLSPTLKDVIAAAKPHLSSYEIQELKELTEYEDIFAVDGEDYRRASSVCHRMDTRDTRKICQPLRILPLAKQK
jgi:hypothetical protein